MKVREVVDAIIDACQTPRIENTCDLLIEGDWEHEVTGIASTFMATVDVIREAISKGANLIITHEPTYFTHLDHTDWLAGDEVYRLKKRLIDENQINIWRFHDYMHATRPDMVFAALNQHLSWTAYEIPEHFFCYQIPATTVGELADFLDDRLKVKTTRIIGDRSARVERVGLLIGGASLGLGEEQMPMRLMRDRDLDVMVCGEIMEWTLCAYVRDAHQLGLNKAMIVLGHNRTEEIGMEVLVGWLQELFPEISVHFTEAGEPFLG